MEDDMNTPSKNILVTLENRFAVAERTMAFQFGKPPGFSYRPGQWIDVRLPNPSETDAEGDIRTLSLASASEEEYLMVATRMRDTAFKRELSKMEIGGKVEISVAGGGLHLHNNASRPAVFLAGGIGVTPFRSILVHAAKQGLPHRIVFFFSNRRPQDAPFLEELEKLRNENAHYTFVPTMTKVSDPVLHWHGETGKIDKEMIARHLDGVVSPVYYVAGPQEMVDGMQKVLLDSGADLDDIRTEGFSGY